MNNKIVRYCGEIQNTKKIRQNARRRSCINGIGGNMQGGEPLPSSLQTMLPGQHMRLLSQQTPCVINQN